MSGNVGLRDSIPSNSRMPNQQEEPLIDLVEGFRILRRRRAWIWVALVLAIAAAAGYLLKAPARYTASSMLVFDIRDTEPFQQEGFLNAAADTAFVDSQVEVLKSEGLARSVVQKLALTSDPEFAAAQAGLSTVVFRLVSTVIPESISRFFADAGSPQPDPLDRAVRIYRKNLTVTRIGLTYAVSVSFRSLDANKAARISNAAIDAYVANELDYKDQEARRANAWLQDRLRELRSLAERTERSVAEYRAKNNPGGAPLNEEQIANIAGERRVVLQDLESSAKTYRALHEALLQRVGEFTQRRSFPATEARVVSKASPPLERSEPRGLLVLAVASLIGLLGGVGAAFAREYLDDTVRSSNQVEKNLGIEYLGALPPVSTRFRRWSRRGKAGNGDRSISTEVGPHRFVVDNPSSNFAETIRSAEIAAELAERSDRKVIGVTSALSNEGKSVVAANLAEMLALAGNSVLLVDADPRSHYGLTPRLTPQAKAGLINLIEGNARAEDVVWRDPKTNMRFLPTIARPTSDASGLTIVSPSTMQKLLQSVPDGYQYIVIDLPPITLTADVKAASLSIDYFVLVIEWGRTSHEIVIEALKTAPLIRGKLLGAILNKASAAR